MNIEDLLEVRNTYLRMYRGSCRYSAGSSCCPGTGRRQPSSASPTWAAPSAPSSPTPSVASSSPHLAGRSEQFLTSSPLHWTGGVLQHGGRCCRVVPRLVPPSARHARAVCVDVPGGVGADHHHPHLPAGRGEQGGRRSSPAPPSVSIPNTEH